MIKGFNSLENIGFIKIISNTKLEEVNTFKILKKVNNSIEIDNQFSFLEEINGFNHLQFIGGNLIIGAVRQIPLFSKLERIGGNCDIYIPPSQLNEDIFGNLEVIEGLLDCDYTNFQKLDSVSRIIIQRSSWNDTDTLKGFDQLKFAGQINIKHNPNLTHIDAFPILNKTYGININQNNKLISITGFKELDSCWNLNIDLNPLLTKIGGFQNLQSIQGDLEIVRNSSITDIDRFNQLKEVRGYLEIHLNPALTKITGFQNLTAVQTLSLNANDVLTDIELFNNLTSLAQLNIINHLKLKQIPEFDKIKKLFRIEIDRNLSLEQLPSFDHIQNIHFFGIDANPNLKEINGFNKLWEVGSLYIGANSNLLSIKGFDRLRYIESDLTIQNRNLRQLDAFGNLYEVAHLDLSENIQLKNIQNFSTLAFIKDELIIKDNLQLNECCLINCWIEQGVIDESKIELTNNGDKCLTIQNIKSNCETSTCKKESDISNLNIIINPVFKDFQFGFGSNKDQTVNYKIYNLYDQKIAQGTVETQRGYNAKTVTLPILNQGHYFLLLFNDDAQEVVKFLKLD